MAVEIPKYEVEHGVQGGDATQLPELSDLNAVIDRLNAVQAILAAVDDVETVTVDATGGTFKLTFNGQQTGALAFNISLAALQTAIQGLSSVGAGNAIVSGVVGAYIITLVGTLADTPQPAMVADSTSLTGNTHTATVVNTPPAPGVAARALAALVHPTP